MLKIYRKKPIKIKYKKNINYILSDINTKLPIKISSLSKMIDKIHIRYPHISKHEVSIICLDFFKTLRELLVRGEHITFRELFLDMHLFVYKSSFGKKSTNFIKIRTKLPGKLK